LAGGIAALWRRAAARPLCRVPFSYRGGQRAAAAGGSGACRRWL